MVEKKAQLYFLKVLLIYWKTLENVHFVSL